MADRDGEAVEGAHRDLVEVGAYAMSSLQRLRLRPSAIATVDALSGL